VFCQCGTWAGYEEEGRITKPTTKKIPASVKDTGTWIGEQEEPCIFIYEKLNL